MCTIQLLKGPVILFPDSALEEGKQSDVLSSFEGGGVGGGVVEEGERNQRKLATSVLLILDHTCFM